MTVAVIWGADGDTSGWVEVLRGAWRRACAQAVVEVDASPQVLRPRWCSRLVDGGAWDVCADVLGQGRHRRHTGMKGMQAGRRGWDQTIVE